MRIYFNTSALNRPFDDLSSGRVRLEAEAVAALLAAVDSGRIEFVTSECLDSRSLRIPDPERVDRVRSLLRGAVQRIAAFVARARELETSGLRGLDALHLASAEGGAADPLVTTDDRMIQARSPTRIAVRVLRPSEALDVLEEGVT